MDSSDILARTTFVLEPLLPTPASLVGFQEILLWAATTVLILVAGLLIFTLLRLKARTSASSVDRSSPLMDAI